MDRDRAFESKLIDNIFTALLLLLNKLSFDAIDRGVRNISSLNYMSIWGL